MKILLISKWVAGATVGDFYYPGVWRDTFELALALKQINLQPAILSSRPLAKHQARFDQEFGQRLKQNSIPHFMAPTQVSFGVSWGKFRWQMFFSELKTIINFRPDIIQYMEFGPSLILPLVNIPIIFYSCYLTAPFPYQTIDAEHKLKNWSKKQSLFEKIINQFINLSYLITNRVIGVNSLSQIAQRNKTLVFMHPQGFAKAKKQFKHQSKIHYIQKGVELNRPKTISKCLSTSKINISFIGSILYAKGIFDLIKALSIVKEKHPSIKLSIAGTGPKPIVLKLKQQIKAKKLKAKYLGSINKANRLKLLFNTDIFCLPSYFDAYPSVILEAQATGLPIVTTKQIDSPVNPKTGIKVNAGDIKALAQALMKLISSKSLRIQMGQQALKQSTKYNWNQAAKKFKKIYSQARKGYI